MLAPRRQRAPPAPPGLNNPSLVGLLALYAFLIAREGYGFVGNHVPTRHSAGAVARTATATASSSLSTSRRLNHRIPAADGQEVFCSAFRASDRPCQGIPTVATLRAAAAGGEGDSSGAVGGGGLVNQAFADEAPVVVKRKRGRPRKVRPDAPAPAPGPVVDSASAAADKPPPKRRGRPPKSKTSATVAATGEGVLPAPKQPRKKRPPQSYIHAAQLAAQEKASEEQYEAARLAAIARRKEIIAAAKAADEASKAKETEVPPPPWTMQEEPGSTVAASLEMDLGADGAANGRSGTRGDAVIDVAAARAAAGLPAIGASGVRFEGTNDEWEADYDLGADGKVVMPANRRAKKEDLMAKAEEMLDQEEAMMKLEVNLGEDEEEEEEEEGEVLAGVNGTAGGNHTSANLAAEETKQDEQQAAIERQGLKVGAFGKERLVYHMDYLVHEELGFCRYLADEFLQESEREPNKIVLEFRDDNIAIPRDDVNLLTRYRAADAARVPLSLLSDSDEWQRHKNKVKERVTKQAINVMDLYAKRERIEREPCRPDGPEMEEFSSGFRHEPTPDQLRCLAEIESDMVWRKVPMDRLLCGDVGFGKTEVALRAMFRAVQNKRQVALLAPTSILAAQHYRTLLARMPEDISVALLRRGNTVGSREIKEAIRNQTLDIVVGTHSLLSRKVEFTNLGLLVIDEEQKFGVNQKEKLKVLSTGVDVLTLTATPIPRTLHMSLTGIRDLSTIFSPPQGRQNVTTYIMKGTDDVVTHALSREMSRGGQVFFVVPKIAQIDEAFAQIMRCMPDAAVAVGHSKVKDLEDVVLQFTLGHGDVLLATSIIENGIDMPNVNSIVIMDSHMFGLSQLYQMRGRVGRSDVAAFTYLLYPPGANLSNEAKRRLKALRELSHLGSGFELANRDLEIRGAGNIFGTDQSGDLKDIGYELYMSMLETAIIELRGTDIQPVPRCDVDMGLGKELEGSVPDDYMTGEPEKRARQIDRLRVANSFTELVRIAKEWVADYGPMPLPVRRLFKRTHLHTACRLLGVSEVRLEYLPSADRGTMLMDAGHGEAAAPSPTATGKEPGAPNGAGGVGAGAGFKRVNGHGGSSGNSDGGGSASGGSSSLELGVESVQVGGALTFKPATVAEAQAALKAAAAARAEGEAKKLVPVAMLRGPDVTKDRWEILFRQAPLRHDMLQYVSFREDAEGVALQAAEGGEEMWMLGDREQWLDHLLALLLPMVEYVEVKQSLHHKDNPLPRKFMC